MIDANGAFFVIGSDAYGTMGAELIPYNRTLHLLYRTIRGKESIALVW